MAWPTDDINLTNTDQGTDSPALARTDINITQQRLKEVIAGRGTADGVCELDASALVPLSRLPTVTVPYGGTGRTSLTANGVLVGAGTGAINVVAPGTSGYVLTSNGTGADPTYQAPQTAVSANDTTPGYLDGKITDSSQIAWTQGNDGGNETFSAGIIDKSVGTSSLADGAITPIKLRQASTGSYVVAASDATKTTSSTSATKVAEILTPYGGTFNVYFQLQSTISTNASYGRIYVNGVAVGTTRTIYNVGTWNTFTEDITITDGDGAFIQLYIWTTSGNEVQSRSFRIREANPVTAFITTL